MSPTLYFLLRPVLLMLFFGMIYGIGSMGVRRNDVLSRFLWGTVFFVPVIFILAFAGMLSPVPAFTLLIAGNISAGLNFRPLLISAGLISQGAVKKPFLTLLLVLLHGLMFVRATAPPYFIDSCQYHLPACDEYINAVGFRDLPDNFLVQTLTTFTAESFQAFGMLLLDDMMPALVMFGFSILGLFMVFDIGRMRERNEMSWLIVLALCGCGAWFDNAIYGKTEPFLIFLLLGYAREWLKSGGEIHPFKMGALTGFIVIAKWSMLMPMGLVGIIFLSSRFRVIKETLREGVFYLLGIAPFCLLVIVKNLFTHGMAFYPFLFDPSVMPPSMPQGLWTYSANTEPAVQKIIKNVKILFLGREAMRHFQPFLFMVSYLLLFSFSFGKRKSVLLTAFLLAIVNWLYYTLFYITPYQGFRLSFPIWAFSMTGLFFGSGFDNKDSMKKKIILVVTVISVLWLINEKRKLIPGVGYHLGRYDKAAYYEKIGLEVGKIAQSKVFQSFHPQGRIAVFSEYVHLARHPKALYVRKSRELERFDSLEDFLSVLRNKNIGFLLIDYQNMGIEVKLKGNTLDFINKGKEEGLLLVEESFSGEQVELLRITSRAFKAATGDLESKK